MRLGLALGGGGARGIAHVGVLSEFEKWGVQPDILTGTSIGGLVGALYAIGMPPAEIAEQFEQLCFSRMYALPTLSNSLMGTNKFEQYLNSIFGSTTFEDLDIPFAVIAADLDSHQEVVINQGDLVSALLATTAIPILLPPIERNGQLLVDGGVVNNLPFDTARQLGASSVIAVNLRGYTNHSRNNLSVSEFDTNRSPPFRFTRLLQMQQLWQVVISTIDIVQERELAHRLANCPPDMMIEPQLGSIHMFDVKHSDEGLQAGRLAAQAVKQKVLQLSATLSRIQTDLFNPWQLVLCYRSFDR